MRLIDADTLIKNLSYLYTKNHIPVDMRAKEILTTIMEQPTAYSVDKLIEEFEKKKQYALEVNESIREHGVWVEAIEIVKQGFDIKQ